MELSSLPQFTILLMCTLLNRPIDNLFVRVTFTRNHLWESSFYDNFFWIFFICENLFFLWKLFESFLPVRISFYLWSSVWTYVFMKVSKRNKSLSFLCKLFLSVRISSFLWELFFFMITFFICKNLCLCKNKSAFECQSLSVNKNNLANGFKKITYYFFALKLTSYFC